jgi:cytochrome P450
VRVKDRAPGPPRRHPLGHALALRRDPLAFLTQLSREHGDVARFRLGPVDVHLVSRPEWIRDVLVTHAHLFHKGRGLERAKRLLGEGLLTSEDPVHLRQRRMMQPAFHRDRIAGYADVMTEHAEKMSGRWRDGETRDVAQEMSRLTLAIVGRTLFDSDVESEAEEIGAALTTAIGLFGRTFSLPFFQVVDRLPLPSNRRFAKARARIDATIGRLVAERRRAPGGRTDLLTLLVQASDTEGDGTGMTDAQVRDEAVTIFLAGHETTAVALSWTFALLARHPQVAEKLHAELDEVLGENTPTVDDLPRLEYTRRVLSESMRLFPPAWMVGRQAINDLQLLGYDVPAGTVLLLSPYLLQRDARWWPDPRRFDPDRWSPEQEATRPKYAYFPFGGGPRLCIGESFAWMEGELLIATIAQRWRPRLSPGYPKGLQPQVTLRPREGMRMTMEPR